MKISWKGKGLNETGYDVLNKKNIILVNKSYIRPLDVNTLLGNAAKAKNMIRDCKLIAEKDGVRFKFNSYFPIKSLNLMRGVFVAEEDNCKSYYIDNIFNAIWQDGLNMNDESVIQKILQNLNINPKTFILRSTSSSIKDYLKERTAEAYKKGIFGAPSFISNNKIFWGQDRLEFVLNEANK